MPSELFKRIDLDLLFGPFLRASLQLIANCHENGSDYFAIYGERDYIEQGKLFALWQAGKGGRAAPPGSSAHHWGIATDFCSDGDLTKPGLQPVWHSKAYDVLGTEARKLGLVWGGGFGDRPHVQWPGFVTGAEMEPLRKLYEEDANTTAHMTDKEIPTGLPSLKQARLQKCWKYLDAVTSSTVWKSRYPNLVQFL